MHTRKEHLDNEVYEFFLFLGIVKLGKELRPLQGEREDCEKVFFVGVNHRQEMLNK